MTTLMLSFRKIELDELALINVDLNKAIVHLIEVEPLFVFSDNIYNTEVFNEYKSIQNITIELSEVQMQRLINIANFKKQRLEAYLMTACYCELHRRKQMKRVII